MSVTYKTDREIPKSIRALCWSMANKLNLEVNASYIIHQVLAFGDMDDVQWLFETYDRKQIENVFFNSPMGKGIYQNCILNFLTKFIFKDIELNEERYNKMLKKLY